MKSSSPSAAASGSPVLWVSCIIHGQFYPHHTPLPFASADDPGFPLNFRQYLVSADHETPPPPALQRSLTFQTNRSYSVDADGFRLPSVEHQAAELERQASEAEANFEALQAPLPEELTAALEDSHAADIGFQLAQAQAEAKRRDQGSEAAAAFIEEQNATDDVDEVVSPRVTEVETPKPKPRRRYVRRGAIWRRVKDVTLRTGEAVFVRDGPSRYEQIGTVGAGGVLPTAYLMKGKR